MTAYNIAINRLDMPARFLRLPIDDRGYPVPKFVAWVDGKPDFRVVDQRWMAQAVNKKLCWLCGEKLGRYLAFVLGPMCAVNRINSEPPSHLDCARFAVKACPFLTQPRRGRNRDEALPEKAEGAAGFAIDRNPGVSLIWITERYQMIRAPGGGVLFQVGDHIGLEWYAHGRKATREEIMTSITSGLPILRGIAKQEGSNAIAELEVQIERGLALVPA
jgi:hypothetical protein